MTLISGFSPILSVLCCYNKYRYQVWLWPWSNPCPSGCVGPHFDTILILFWAATSASSQLIPILDKSLLMVLLQFARWRPGPLLNPGTSQCNACCGLHWWSIRITCPSQRSLLSLSMSSMLCCPVLTLTSSFVTLSFQEMPKMLLCRLWWAAFNILLFIFSQCRK